MYYTKLKFYYIQCEFSVYNSYFVYTLFVFLCLNRCHFNFLLFYYFFVVKVCHHSLFLREALLLKMSVPEKREGEDTASKMSSPSSGSSCVSMSDDYISSLHSSSSDATVTSDHK